MTKTVCIVTETYAPEINGVANTLKQWVLGLQAKGIYVQLVRPKQNKQDVDSKLVLESHTVVPGLPIPGYSELKFGLPAKRKIRKLWRQMPADVVYVATEGPLGYSAVKVAKQMDIPVISGFHTNFQSYSRFYKLGFMENVILSYLRYFHNETLGTLVPTDKQKNWLESKGFENVHVLRRGINAKRFNPGKRSIQLRREWGIGDNELALLYVGRIAAEKNMELLSQTITSLENKHVALRFIFVGSGPMESKMRQRHPNAVFCGMKTGEELATHYASSDVFLFPSKTDTFGNVVTEAMASKLAIVSFDDAAAKEHLVDEISALLVDLDKDSNFIDSVERLIKERRLLDQIRHSAWTVAQDITWQEIVNQFTDILGIDSRT